MFSKKKEVIDKKKKIKEEEEIPTFSAPGDSVKSSDSSKAEDVKAVCYKHPEEEAYATCSSCGRNICKECAESCSVNGGTYSGKYLCYDCCENIFKEQERKLKRDKNKIMFQYALTIIGVLLGACIGADGGAVNALMFAAIGGAFLTAIKPIASSLKDIIVGVIELAVGGNFMSAIVNMLVGVVKFLIVVVQCTIRTVIKLVSYTRYLISANKAIQETQEALQQLADFMEYMEVRQRTKNFDLDTLLSEGNDLHDNTYARFLKENGEEKADEMLCRATTIIAENGEIIRNFAVS